MADTRTPVRGRSILRLSAQTSPRSTDPAAPQKYARAFMLRLARRLANSAARKLHSVAKRPHVPFSPEAQAKRAARLAPAADFLAQFIQQLPPGHLYDLRCLVSVWCDGSLDQALQALRAADPRQAVKMLNLALEQIREPIEASAPNAAQAQAERLRVAQAIRTTRLMMANPAHLPAKTVGAPALSLVTPAELDDLLCDFQPQHFPDLYGATPEAGEEWAVAA